MILLFYTTFISVDLAHHEIFYSKVGKGAITLVTIWVDMDQVIIQMSIAPYFILLKP